MKNLSLLFMALTFLIDFKPLEAYDNLNEINHSVRKLKLSEIPSDENVIHSFGKASRKRLPPKKWSFLVWNLHKGADKTFAPEYLGLSFGRDVIMNQEVYLNKNMKDVFKFLPFHKFEMATSFFAGNGKTPTGVANISTVEPQFTKFIRTINLEPILSSPKITLITSYPIHFSKRKLTVVNIHGINFVSTSAFRAELERIYQEIKDIPAPMVFSGDFNTWNLERTTILNQYIQKLNMNTVSFLPDNRTTFRGYPLDHFFYTNDIAVTNARSDAYFNGSDHQPLTVEVEYTPSKDEEEDLDTDLEFEDEIGESFFN